MIGRCDYAYYSKLRRNDGQTKDRFNGAGGENEYNPREFIHTEKRQGEGGSFFHIGGNLQIAKMPAGGYIGICGGNMTNVKFWHSIYQCSTLAVASRVKESAYVNK